MGQAVRRWGNRRLTRGWVAWLHTMRLAGFIPGKPHMEMDGKQSHLLRMQAGFGIVSALFTSAGASSTLAAFVKWHNSVVSGKEQYERLVGWAVKSWRELLLAKGLRRWREVAGAWKHKERVLRMGVVHWWQRMMGAGFNTWRAVSSGTRYTEGVGRRAARHWMQ